MSVKVYKNFLSAGECRLLNDCALRNLDKWFGRGITTGGKPASNRITTRMYMGGKKYSPEVIAVSTKVRDFLGIGAFPLINDHGSDGVVISMTHQGDNVYAHRDPRSADGQPTYRCNILTQANEDGAELYVAGKKIEVGVGDLHCYMVSELEHYVTGAKGPTPRIMYMFGAHIPKEHWSDYGLS